MEFEVKINWIINSIIGDIDNFSLENKLFNVEPNVGHLTKLSLNPNLCYFPFLFNPTNVFYNYLFKYLKSKNHYNISNKKFPFEINYDITQNYKVNFKIKVFPPNIISLKVSTTKIILNDWSEFIEIQKIENHKPIYDIIKFIVGNLKSINSSEIIIDNKFRYKPIITIFPKEIEPNFDKYKELFKKNFIGILIRKKDYLNISDEICDNIITKNKEINKKDISCLNLIDKMGVLIIKSKNIEYQEHIWTELLFELGIVIQLFLEKFEDYRNSKNAFIEFLLFKIKSFNENYLSILSASTGKQKIWEIIVDEFKILQKLTICISNNFIDNKDEKIKYFNAIGDNWWEQENYECYFNEQQWKVGDLNLSFIKEEMLRDLIISDYSEAERNFKIKSYKTTIILCGSIIEAILRDVYLNDPEFIANNTDIKNFILKEDRRYDFNFMITSLERFNLVEKNSPIVSLLTYVRQYRNFIHPAVSVRSKEKADENIANIAILAVKSVIKYFTKKYL